MTYQFHIEDWKNQKKIKIPFVHEGIKFFAKVYPRKSDENGTHVTWVYICREKYKYRDGEFICLHSNICFEGQHSPSFGRIDNTRDVLAYCLLHTDDHLERLDFEISLKIIEHCRPKFLALKEFFVPEGGFVPIKQ